MIRIENDRVFIRHDDGREESHAIGTPEAFRIISALWLRSGWDTKYVYSFTWLGRPVIQLPEDLIRLQEIVYTVRPTVIIETGVAHGGSLVFFASLCSLLGTGRVIGVDIEIRPHNRVAIEQHPLASFITLIEGSSTDPSVVREVAAQLPEGGRVLVFLDSNHTRDHVLAELAAYAPLIDSGSYVIVTDGIMQDVVGAPRTQPDWAWNNPQEAAREFVRENPAYRIVEPEFLFNEGVVSERITYWPSCFVTRVSPE